MFRAVLVSLTFAVTAHAQVQDTINKKTPLFVGKDALLLGAFTLGTFAVAPLDVAVAKRLQYPWVQENRFLKRSATGLRLLAVPGSLITGAALYGIGRADGQRRLQA